jgi:hypothetical protein
MLTACQTTKGLMEPARQLREDIPELIGGDASTQRAVTVDGAMSVQGQGADRGRGRGNPRARWLHRAKRLGSPSMQATEAEVADAMGVVVMMNGALGTGWPSRAPAVHREFSPPGSKR